MKTTIINIYGAPGAGKSTLAAQIYSELSKKGESVELVREVAKSYAWKGIKPTVFEQIFITTEQMLHESSLYGKVKYVVTDSPIDLGHFYCNYYHKSNALINLEAYTSQAAEKRELINKPINLFVTVCKPFYTEQGRYSSYEESIEIEKELIECIDPLLMRLKILDLPETRLEKALEVISTWK